MRSLRLGLGIYVLTEALRAYDIMFGVLASVLILQAVFNVGCCRGGMCYTKNAEPKDVENNEIVFEEIKNNNGKLSGNN